jgi:hypothetical protein
MVTSLTVSAALNLQGVYRDLVGKPEGKRPVGRPRLRWERIILTMIISINVCQTQL